MKKTIIGLLLLFLPQLAFAEEPLRVGLSAFSPLVVKESGKFTGFDVELWEAVAELLGRKFTYELHPFPQLLPKVETGALDVALAGITINAAREKRVDFSHHYLDSGLTTMVRATSSIGMLSALSTLFNRSTLLLMLGFLGFSVACGHILWFSERGSPAIDDRYFPGIFEAFWCTIATATTVGYGDVVPKKWLGRFAALFVMLAGIGFFGILSAELMSSLTTLKLSSDIENIKDLRGRKVATVAGTTSVSVLQTLQSKVTTVTKIDKAYNMLRNEIVDAVVFDAPVLMHYVRNEGAGEAFVTGGVFDAQYYGIALPQGSELREQINQALLELRSNGRYDDLFKKWFGDINELSRP